MIVLLMGVSGAGKTTVGARLAAALGAAFHEGDAFHPPENVTKMARGEPLTDDDRAPWLAAIAAAMADTERTGARAVFACSALRRRYRDLLRAACPALRLVHLNGGEALIRERLTARRGHFMPPALLPSQFRTLEPPEPDEHPIVADIATDPESLVAQIRDALTAAPR